MDWILDSQLFTAIAASTTEGAVNPGSSVDVGTGPINRTFIIRIVAVSLIVWFVKWLISVGVGRAQLIHHLYSDIEVRVNDYIRLWERILSWRGKYLEGERNRSKPQRRRFGYIREDPHLVYCSAMDGILTYLWTNEIDKIHKIYRDFLEIEEKLDNVRQILSEQANDLTKLDDDDREWISDHLDAVQDKVAEWNKLPMRPCDTRGRVVARDVFHRPTAVYGLMILLGFFGTLLLLWLIIDIAKGL